MEFPLPGKIPRPDATTAEKMRALGFLIDNSTEEYINYTMPNEWSLTNHTTKDFAQKHFFRDSEGNPRVEVCGCWKGLYDNKLYIQVLSDRRAAEIVESERKDAEKNNRVVRYENAYRMFFISLRVSDMNLRAYQSVKKAHESMVDAYELLTFEEKPKVDPPPNMPPECRFRDSFW